jgi:CO/xanthine dehydrogenase FAD-binding subunit
MEIERYIVANSLKEAYELLNESHQNLILGGGLWLKHGTKSVDTMIDISKLGLNEITETKQNIEIGALVTLRELETNPMIITIGGGFLAKAIGSIVGVQFRNLATIGGSIFGKYPFSDLVTALLCLNVKLKFFPKEEMSLIDFLDQKGKTNKILTHITIEKEQGKGFFKKVANTMQDFSILNVAVYKHDTYKIVIGARPGKPVVASSAMEIMNQAKSINQEVIDLCAKSILQTISFGDDTRGSKEYREVLAETYVKRGIKEVMNHEG